MIGTNNAFSPTPVGGLGYIQKERQHGWCRALVYYRSVLDGLGRFAAQHVPTMSGYCSLTIASFTEQASPQCVL